MPNYTRFISHQGKEIVFMDFSRVQDDEDAFDRLAQAKAFVARQPANSLLTVVDVSDSRFNTRVIAGLRELALHNKPYVKASALYGVSELQAIIIRGVNKITGRDLHVADGPEVALDYVVASQIQALRAIA